MDYSLKEILDNVEQIREAIYGEEVRGSISDSIEMMAYETDTIQGFKDGVDQTLADFKSQYEQNFRDFADSIHRDMNQFETKITEDFEGFKSEVNREINNHKTEMDNKFFEFKQSVHLTIADFTNDMTAKMDTIQDEWIKFQQNTNLEISNFKMEMQNKYQEFTERIIKENSELKESVKTDIAGMKNDIMTFKETTEQTLAQYQQELGETITSWDKTLTDKLAQHTIEMETIKKEIYDKLDEASQADPNLELVDAREGETTLKENLNKNYTKKSELEPLQTSISELTDTTTALGGRTDKLEQYVTKHPNPVLTINKQSPDDTGNIDISGGNIEATEVTYSELTQLIADSKLVTGGIYLLTDYKTIYKQPISDEIKMGETEELYLTATSTNTLSPTAYSKQYPQDIIIYDTYNNKVGTTPRPGFIIWRKDTKLNNEAPYDFREVKFIRYSVHPTQYMKYGVTLAYKTLVPGTPVEVGDIYKDGKSLYISTRRGTPNNFAPMYFSQICLDMKYIYMMKNTVILDSRTEGSTNLLISTAHELPTFGTNTHDNIIVGHLGELSNNVLIESCSYNRIQSDSYQNTLCYGCNYNKIESNSVYNVLMESCYHNVLDQGYANILMYSCDFNIINHSRNNSLGMADNNQLYYNSSYNFLGHNCEYNIFENATYNRLLSSNYRNKIGKKSDNNELGFYISDCILESLCERNKFESNCLKITLRSGCVDNKFGSDCTSITFNQGCSRNTLGAKCDGIHLDMGCVDNNISDKVHELTMTTNCWGNTLGENCGSVHFLGNVINCKFRNDMYSTYIYSLNGKDVTQISELYNRGYDTIIQKGASGTPTYYYSYIKDGSTIIKQIP